MDIQPGNGEPMRELHLFAGAGGGILGGQLLGHRCVCAVEWEPYAQAVLVARQNDGTFPPFPIWSDAQNFDGRPWRGRVDVVAGGFPCQDISVAGKGAGLDGERSGMWHHMARIIGEVRPRFAFIENSPALVNRGLDRVLCDLAALGMSARWGVISAADCGAPHLRERIWIVAHAESIRHGQGREARDISGQDGRQDRPLRTVTGSSSFEPENMASANGQRQQGQRQQVIAGNSQAHSEREADKPFRYGQRYEWPAEPSVGRVVDGMANRSHRLKAIGNGQVPICAAMAFALLAGRIQ